MIPAGWVTGFHPTADGTKGPRVPGYAVIPKSVFPQVRAQADVIWLGTVFSTEA